MYYNEIGVCLSIEEKIKSCVFVLSLQKSYFFDKWLNVVMSYIDTALSFSLQLREHVPHDRLHVEGSRIGPSM